MSGAGPCGPATAADLVLNSAPLVDASVEGRVEFSQSDQRQNIFFIGVQLPSQSVHATIGCGCGKGITLRAVQDSF